MDQTFPAKEIIVVDDNSADGSQQVLDTFADSITVVKNTNNVGANAARNIGASKATGDYLVFLDGDDSSGAKHLPSTIASPPSEIRFRS